jgi:hypothetical protein
MGGIFSAEGNKAIKDRNTQKRIDEMAAERGIRFPGPNEDLTEMPDFENAGDAFIYFTKLSKKQVKQVKDIPFRLSGRRPLSLVERDALTPLSHDSLTKITGSSGIQELIRIIKSGGEGAEVLIGAKNGGPILSMRRGAPYGQQSAPRLF